jgi:ferrous iron transport protein B
MSVHTIAVVGVPNVGKSTLFNELTGLQQRVGNFPGVTVEPMVGSLRDGSTSLTVIDLPGIYGLTAASEDEQLSIDVLRGVHPSIPRPDVIMHVVSADHPSKCFGLFAELSTLGIPMIVVATMVDAVKARGGVFDDITLHHRLGVPILPVVGTKGLGMGELRDALFSHAAVTPQPVDVGSSTVEARAAWARTILDDVIVQGRADSTTMWLDRIVLNPIGGALVFVLVMALFFQMIFAWAQPLMDGIDALMAVVSDTAAQLIGNDLARSFVVKGLLGGVGSILVFLPQIIILNVLVTILEECGYLARAAFLVDRAMGVFGLQGRSFIPLLGSFACAIPGIMSARIIPSYRDRMATIMATPLMTCSARLPVYTLLISSVVPAVTIIGGFSLQAVVMAGLYVLGALSGLLVALVLKRTMFRGAVVPFMIEFPPYRVPSLRSMSVTMINRTRDFVTTAGTVILTFSIALWILTELPRTQPDASMTELQQQQHQLDNSFAADLGRAIQPVFAPLGFDWRITLGVLSSYAARETFVSAMGQIYAADVAESDAPLREVLQERIPLRTGLSILAFYVFALQCISTMAIMKRETGSWKWPTLAFGITFVMAYVASFVVYNVF